MKKLIVSLVLLFATVASSVNAADYYKVTVKRVDQDLYSFTTDTQKGVIVTQSCYGEYVYADEALLKYNKYEYDNWLLFSDNNKCVVKGVYLR